LVLQRRFRVFAADFATSAGDIITIEPDGFL
jgi:hypothetical protein